MSDLARILLNPLTVTPELPSQPLANALAGRFYLYIVPASGGWRISSHGVPQTGIPLPLHNIFPTQHAALQFASGWSNSVALRGWRVELKIQGRDGQFRDGNTYPRATDPNPPRG